MNEARELAETSGGIVDVMERAAFNDACAKYKAKFEHDALLAVKAIGRVPTVASLKGATFTHELADMGAGQQHLRLDGVDKAGNHFEIALDRTNPRVDGDGVWSGTISIVAKDGQVEGRRALSAAECAALGGNSGITRWFNAAPDMDRVGAAADVLRARDYGFTLGPNVDAADLPASWQGKPLLAYKDFAWKDRPKGAVLTRVTGEANDMSYEYTLMFCPNGKTFAIRESMGTTEIAELTPYL